MLFLTIASYFGSYRFGSDLLYSRDYSCECQAMHRGISITLPLSSS